MQHAPAVGDPAAGNIMAVVEDVLSQHSTTTDADAALKNHQEMKNESQANPTSGFSSVGEGVGNQDNVAASQETANPHIVDHVVDGVGAAVAAALAETREAAMALRLSSLRVERDSRSAAARWSKDRGQQPGAVALDTTNNGASAFATSSDDATPGDPSTKSQQRVLHRSGPGLANNGHTRANSLEAAVDVRAENVVAQAERRSVRSISLRLQTLDQALLASKNSTTTLSPTSSSFSSASHVLQLSELRSELFELREVAKGRYLQRALRTFGVGHRRGQLVAYLMKWMHACICRTTPPRAK